MVGANTIAGEAESGTIKTVLVRPVRRGSLLCAKWAISVGYLAAALAVVFVVGLVAGLIAFGIHSVFIHLGPYRSRSPSVTRCGSPSWRTCCSWCP